MALINIFDDDAFSLVELTAALRDVEYRPSMLGTMGIFTPDSVRTETVAIERQGEKLALVPTSLRGAPPTSNKGQERRNIRDFRTVRLAVADRITASEIQNIREFGSETEMQQVQTETLKRFIQMRDNLELTKEHMRLGAVQGIVTDADGSTIYDWFSQWGISQNAELTWNFKTLKDGAFRRECNKLVRATARASQGAWINGVTRLVGLCGDQFYDDMTTSDEVRSTFLGWQAAADLRESMGQPFEAFSYGGIAFINYRGTDDQPGGSAKVGIDPNQCKFFPVNAPNVFMEVHGPGEFFGTINQPGQEYYALTIPDEKRDAYVDTELYSYPLHVCTRPKMLNRAKLG